MKKFIVLLLSSIFILLACLNFKFIQVYCLEDNISSYVEEERTLTSSEISSIIHEKVQREQAEQNSHYNPVSVSIAILIIGVVAFFVIKWEKKK